MDYMLFKLLTDLSKNWVLVNSKNIKFIFILALVALPVSVLINFKLVQKFYLSPNFALLTESSEIRNAVIVDEYNNALPLESYLVEEITNTYDSLKVSFERTINIAKGLPEQNEFVSVSFFSGGYDSLDIAPYAGAFTSMEYPLRGSRLEGAITYDYWINEMNSSSDAIGSHLMLNDRSVRIVAIMPKGFVSFRRNQPTDIIIPYSFIEDLLEVESSLTPDTFSYLVGKADIDEAKLSAINSELRENALLLDEESINLNKAIGVNNQEYARVMERINNLSLVFYLLLGYSLISFVAFWCGETYEKQQEIEVRKLCGANDAQIYLQNFLDVFITTLLVVVFVLVFILLSKQPLLLLLPEISIVELEFDAGFTLTLAFTCFVAGFVFLWLVAQLQMFFTKTNVGRGESVSAAQRNQSYFLLAFMLLISCVSVYISSSLFAEQVRLLQSDPGFSSDNKYVVTFEFPDISGRTFYSSDSSKLLVSAMTETEGVDAFAITSSPPLSDRTAFAQMYTPSKKPIGSGALSSTTINIISPSFFSSIGATILKGKTVNWNNPQLVVVNEALWKSFYLNEQVGAASILQLSSGEYTEFTIVGVVKDIYSNGPDSPPAPTIYKLNTALTGTESFIVGSSLSESELAGIIDSEIQQIDVGFTNLNIESLNSLMESENAPRLSLLIITFVASSIVVLSAAIFCRSVIQQLMLKNARDLCLRYSIGCSNIRLLQEEMRHFMRMIIPVTALGVALFNSIGLDMAILNEALNKANHLIILIILLLSLSLITCIFFTNIHKHTKNSWKYLS